MHKEKIKYQILALSTLFPNKEYPALGIFVMNRLRAIQRHHDIRVVAPIPTFPFKNMIRRFKKFSAIPAREQIEGLDVVHPRFSVIPRYLKWVDSISLFLSTIQTIFRLSRRYKLDLIDVHWTYPEILTAFIWARFLKIRFIVTIRGKEALYLSEKSLRRYIIKTLLKQSDAVITLSSELKDIVKYMGIAAEKIHVIRNGVETSKFYLMDKQECRKRIGIPEGKKIILSAGSLILRKGHHKIIELLPALAKKHDIELYVIGSVGPEGDDLAFLENLIKRLGLENVHLVGSVLNNDLSCWYNAADIFCLSSSGEGCPNVVLEALACGTPVVASNVGEINNIIDTDVKGYVFELDKPDDLEFNLNRALDCQWDREAISVSMQQQTWDMCAKNVNKIYEKVMNGNC